MTRLTPDPTELAWFRPDVEAADRLYPTPEANCNTLSVALEHVDNAEMYARASQDLDVEASCMGAPDSIASLAARYALQTARDWLATEAYYVACQDKLGFAIHDVFAHLDDARTDAMRAARECNEAMLVLRAGRIVERVAAPEAATARAESRDDFLAAMRPV